MAAAVPVAVVVVAAGAGQGRLGAEQAAEAPGQRDAQAGRGAGEHRPARQDGGGLGARGQVGRGRHAHSIESRSKRTRRRITTRAPLLVTDL
jgi:hypothetical protein